MQIKHYFQEIFQIQSHDWEKLLNLSLLNFQVLTAITFGMIVSTSLFIKRVGVEYLPNMYIVNAISILFCTVIYFAIASRVDKIVLFKSTAIFSGIIILITRGLIFFNVVWIYPVLYVIASIITWIFSIQFWAIAVDMCNVRESRRIFSYIVSAGLFGGIIAGVIVRYATGILNTRDLILIWSLFLFLVVRSSRVIPSDEKTETTEEDNLSPIKSLVETATYLTSNRLVRMITISFLVYGVAVYFLDFQFNRIVDIAYPDQDKLTKFYGIYSVCFYGVTFLIQIFFATRIIKWLGIGKTMIVFPSAVALGFVALVAKFGYISGIFAKFIRDVIGNSLVDSAYPVLFNPIDEKHRSKALALVEGFVIPIGAGLAGVLLLMLRGFSPIYISLSGIVIGLIWIYATVKLKMEYHNAFMENVILKSYHEGREHFEESIDITKRTTLNVLKKAIYDPNRKVSIFAIETLGKTRDKLAVKPLIELLSNPESGPVIKATIIKALGNIKDTYPLLIISKYLEDPDDRVRANAVESLGEIGGLQVKDLINPCLKDSSSRVRINTAAVLWKYGEHEKAKKLISEIFTHSDEESRIRATHTMSQIGDRELLPLLIEASYDSSPKVRYQSIEGLSRIDDEWSKESLIQTLSDKNNAVRENARKTLTKMQNVTDRLLKVMNSENQTIKDKVALILAEKREEKAVKPVIDYCVSRIKSAYQNIIYIETLLSVKKKTPGINLLIGTLNTRNRRLAAEVLKLTSYLEKSEAISSGIKRLKDKDEKIKAEVIEMLETTDTEYNKILELTIPLLEDISAEDKLDIAEREFGLKQKYFNGIIEEMLHGSDEWLKGCAIFIMGEIKENRFLEDIVKETENNSLFIRETALGSVIKISPIRGKKLSKIQKSGGVIAKEPEGRPKEVLSNLS